MIRVLLTMVITVLFFSCISEHEQRILKLNNIVKAIDNIPVDRNISDTLLKLENLLDEIHDTTYMVYLLNSDCSFCLAQFFSFADIYSSSKNVPVYVIVNEGTIDYLNYYDEKYRKSYERSGSKIIYYENRNHEYYNANIDINIGGTIYYFSNNKLLKLFRVEETEILNE